MSLVAYGSSDESDSDEPLTFTAADSQPSGRSLFSVLPTPKKRGLGQRIEERDLNKGVVGKPFARDSLSNEDPGLKPSTGVFSNLPKPKKRSEPVRIPAPQVHQHDSDSDDDEPARKKSQPQGGGTGLSSILPQPKNLTLKNTDRPLIPYTLTKRQEPKGAKPAGPAQGLVGSSASPSAIKAAAKSAALQVARQIATEDQDNEDDITPQNYFSLEESTQPLSVGVQGVEQEPGGPSDPASYAAADDQGQSDSPLHFGGNPEEASAWGDQYTYQQPTAAPEDFPEGYYNDQYYQDSNPAQAESEGDTEEPGQSDMFDDEGFMRLQGKRNRGKEEIKFLEIKGDDQLSGNKQWMTKNMTEEKQTRQSFSKKRGGLPTGQQRRKHQITYLIHQAKERELELKNNWAENRLSRRQTQAKYGF